MDVKQATTTRQASKSTKVSKKKKQKKGKLHKRPQPTHSSEEFTGVLRKALASRASTSQSDPMLARAKSTLIDHHEGIDYLQSFGRKEMSMFARTVFGTQEPVLRLRTDQTLLASSVASTIDNVIALDVTGIHNWATGWAKIFDEYQPLHARVYFVPIQACSSLLVTTNSNIVTPVWVVVDYDDPNALTSSDEAVAYDTRKLFMASRPNPKEFYIDAYPQGLPDKAWVETSTGVTWGWIKMHGLLNTAVASVNFAIIHIEFTLRFRQAY